MPEQCVPHVDQYRELATGVIVMLACAAVMLIASMGSSRAD